MGNDPALVIFAVLFPVLLVGEAVLLALLWRTGGGRLPRLSAPPEAAAPEGHGPETAEPQRAEPEGKVASEVWLVTVWAVSTGLAMAMAFVATFVAVHVLLFTLGTQAAMVGLIGSAIFLGAIPVVVAILVHRRARPR
jgi:hypothetical protein